MTSMTRRSFAVSVAALSAAMAANGARAQGRPLYKDPAAPIDARIEDLLKRMTLEEKVAQMQGVWEHKDLIQTPDGTFSPEMAARVFPNGIGQISRPSDRRGVKAPNAGAAGAAGAQAGVPNRNPRETADYINAAQRWAMEKTRLGIPLLMHDEALHGYVAREATSFPQAIALASTWDPALVERVFSTAAFEARARGTNIVLAPVVDVARDPRWGRIEETYGEDPYLVGEIGLGAIRGFQGTTLPLAKDKVFVTLKHLTGHGMPEGGTNVGPADMGERELREVFFPPFKKAIESLPVRAVMPSYNEIDGVPSHANRWLLTDVLRGEWGFKGAATSDYFAIRELIVRHHMTDNLKDAAVLALNAGVDVELPDGEAYPNLPQLVREGRVSEAQIDAAVRRILRMKFEGGLFENPYADAATANAKTATPHAIALAREAARKAVVLLKNDKGLLPLDASKIRRLAILGTHARDTPIGGYSDKPRHVVSILEGVTEEARGRFAVDYAEGVRITEGHVWEQDEVVPTPPEVNARLRAEALEVARRADVILMVLGGNEAVSREAWADNHLGDTEDLNLPGEQNEFARAIFELGKPTVVFLLNGRPMTVNLLAERADALIEGWYLGQETGHAAADILFGHANPGGKLPVTIPRDVGQLPMFYNHKPTAHRGYLFGDVTPLYPFGFGLSYTTFEISAPRPAKAKIGLGETLRVDVDVANTGSRAGDEVVQLYIHDEEASVTRPVLELKGFQRVTLQPGERRTVSFDLTPDKLALWDIHMKHVVEPGDFTVYAGPNSAQLKSARFTVTA